MMKTNQIKELPNSHLLELASDALNEALWSDQKFIKLLKALSKEAEGLELKIDCEDHAIQMDIQMERLRNVFKMTGIKMKAKENKIMGELIEDVFEAIENFRGKEAFDTVIITGTQKAGQHRIAIYESASIYLELMEFEEAGLILEKISKEEYMANDQLVSIAWYKLVPINKIPHKKKGMLANVQEFFNS